MTGIGKERLEGRRPRAWESTRPRGRDNGREGGKGPGWEELRSRDATRVEVLGAATCQGAQHFNVIATSHVLPSTPAVLSLPHAHGCRLPSVPRHRASACSAPSLHLPSPCSCRPCMVDLPFTPWLSSSPLRDHGWLMEPRRKGQAVDWRTIEAYEQWGIRMVSVLSVYCGSPSFSTGHAVSPCRPRNRACRDVKTGLFLPSQRLDALSDTEVRVAAAYALYASLTALPVVRQPLARRPLSLPTPPSLGPSR